MASIISAGLAENASMMAFPGLKGGGRASRGLCSATGEAMGTVLKGEESFGGSGVGSSSSASDSVSGERGACFKALETSRRSACGVVSRIGSRGALRADERGATGWD